MRTLCTSWRGQIPEIRGKAAGPAQPPRPGKHDRKPLMIDILKGNEWWLMMVHDGWWWLTMTSDLMETFRGKLMVSIRQRDLMGYLIEVIFHGIFQGYEWDTHGRLLKIDGLTIKPLQWSEMVCTSHFQFGVPRSFFHSVATRWIGSEADTWRDGQDDQLGMVGQMGEKQKMLDAWLRCAAGETINGNCENLMWCQRPWWIDGGNIYPNYRR